mgnify:CR=1 FL=1
MDQTKVSTSVEKGPGWYDWLNAPVSIAPLVTLRVAYGLLMLISTLRFVALGWVSDHFIEPQLHFKYYGFEWVEPLGPTAMYVIHGLMILACVGIVLGLFYRWSALLFAVLFTYCELIDITYYLNHYYFISLTSFLMVLIPAHRQHSMDVRLRLAQPSEVAPRWTVALFMLQIGIVYCYAGLAKINYAWLIEAMPLKLWLPAHNHLPLIGWAMPYEATAYLFSWFGMFYDTFIVFFLLWRPTRPWAYLAVIGFHLMTGLLFQIGMFPLVMIAMTLIFFSPAWHQRVHRWAKLKGEKGDEKVSPTPPWALGLLAMYVAIQLLFPWRYLLYEGNLFWREEGYRFSWRVMLMEKAGTATFYVKDRATGREGIVDNREFLNPHQEKQMAFQPDLILQYAHWLADHYAQQGLADPAVRAEVYVTLNGRPSQLLIDPTVDLTRVEDSWAPKAWIMPWK